ncbi:MAG: endolytic transglycosylase MltG, partial [Syntrophomonadaceae bacterium]|nr:endolytic transglycosylase MltG [Syntrophomonadaceae bacterium]
DSPYNTYKHVGLPPGPIAAPGKDSIKAALNPEKHSYFYYVSRGDGTHEFTKNFNEHLQAISKYNN